MLSLNLFSSRSSSILCTLALIAASGIPLRAQDPATHGPVVTDWSTRHTIFSDPGPERGAIEKGRYQDWWKVTSDPRYLMQQRRRHHEPGPPRDKYWQKDTAGPHRDWAVSLGAGTVAQNQSPAKFSFNINETINAAACAGDYVVYGLNVAGGSDATASGVFSASSTSGATITITVNGTQYQFTAVNGGGSNSSTTYVHNGNLGTEAGNLKTAIGDNAALAALVSVTTNTPTNGEVALKANAVGGTITIAASTTPNNADFGSITSSSGASGGQANLVALNNLYTGASSTSCAPFTTAQPYWAYNVSYAGGQVSTSPSISDDATGSEVIFVESGGTSGPYLHILRWNSADGGTATASAAPAHGLTSQITSLSGCTAGASCLVSILLNSTTETITNSSPYYDYANDVIYVGDDAGNLYKVTPVLGAGTPVVSKVNLAATKLTGPVYDSGSGYVFVGGSNGYLYAVTASNLSLPAHSSIKVGYGCANSGLIDPPIVDGTDGYVFETSIDGTNNNNTVVVQAFTNTAPNGKSGNTNYPGGSSWTAAATANVGEGDTGCNAGNTFYAHDPDFDNAYFTSPSSGHLIVGGADQNPTTDYPALWSVPFTAGPPALLGTATEFAGAGAIPHNGNTSGAEMSPVTEIYNGSTDYAFFGVGSSNYGELYGFKVTDSTPYFTQITGQPIAYPNGVGGTSGIVVDNVSPSAQASSIYFTTMGVSAGGVPCTTGTYCAIKLTQSTLQ